MRGALLVGAALVCVALVWACDDSPPANTPQTRRDVVHADGSTTARPAPSGKTSVPTAKASIAPHRTGPLCEEMIERDKPPSIPDARAVGSAAKPAELKYDGGRWTWVNVWAAWCGPCKEEMPRLLAWRDQLKAEGVKIELAFVSIDDDERELTRFLEAQPEKGVRSSWWLPAEDARAKWFSAIGFDDLPQLPVHAFINPAGKLTCTVTGALDPPDYPALQKVFARR
jgi:thiol-disulfide isomerase/thioredoxin